MKWLYNAGRKELTDQAHKPTLNLISCSNRTVSMITHVSKVTVQHFHVSVDNFECHQFVILWTNTANKEEWSISPIDHLCVFENKIISPAIWHRQVPLYSRKLHIRVRRASTSCVTSFTILAFVFGGSVVNHLASRTLPEKHIIITVVCSWNRISKQTLPGNKEDVVDHEMGMSRFVSDAQPPISCWNLNSMQLMRKSHTKEQSSYQPWYAYG